MFLNLKAATMHLQQNVSLLPYNTFGIEARAEYFAEVHSVEALQEALRAGIRPVLMLGGGSNMLFTGDVAGLVVKNAISGLRVLREFQHRVWVEAGAGVVWHDFVTWAVQHGYGGVENLSLIPGTVGAAPVQNIGAYGVELKDVFVRLKALNLDTGRMEFFSKRDCRFGYRDSFFKGPGKGRYGITSVVFSLKKAPHRIHIAYGDIRKTLENNGVNQPGIADISRAIVQIRSTKLPDPSKIGNSGSFFKNPEISAKIMENIRRDFPEAPGFPLPNGRIKIPAGWLIEQCGWKGKRVGNTGSYEKQALVLVNYGGATGAEVKKLAVDIVNSVEKKFGISLEAEVNMIG